VSTHLNCLISQPGVYPSGLTLNTPRRCAWQRPARARRDLNPRRERPARRSRGRELPYPLGALAPRGPSRVAHRGDPNPLVLLFVARQKRRSSSPSPLFCRSPCAPLEPAAPTNKILAKTRAPPAYPSLREPREGLSGEVFEGLRGHWNVSAEWRCCVSRIEHSSKPRLGGRRLILPLHSRGAPFSWRVCELNKRRLSFFFSSLFLSSLELSDTQVYEP